MPINFRKLLPPPVGSIHLSLRNDGYILDTLDEYSLEKIPRLQPLVEALCRIPSLGSPDIEVVHAQLTVFFRYKLKTRQFN